MGTRSSIPHREFLHWDQRWGKLAPPGEANGGKSIPIRSGGFEDVPPDPIPKTRIPAPLVYIHVQNVDAEAQVQHPAQLAGSIYCKCNQLTLILSTPTPNRSHPTLLGRQRRPSS